MESHPASFDPHFSHIKDVRGGILYLMCGRIESVTAAAIKFQIGRSEIHGFHVEGWLTHSPQQASIRV